MRFEEAYQGWTGGRLTQAEAALLLGQCERSFRRHVDRYEEDGMQGLLDKRLSQISKRRAAQAEIDHVVQTYKSGFAGWNVAHFHSKYRSESKGARSYSWEQSLCYIATILLIAPGLMITLIGMAITAPVLLRQIAQWRLGAQDRSMPPSH